jgi:hypothetical protein
MTRNLTSAEFAKRQDDYDALVEHFLGYSASMMSAADRQSGAAWELHQRVVRILDGKEPDPRKAKP